MTVPTTTDTTERTVVHCPACAAALAELPFGVGGWRSLGFKAAIVWVPNWVEVECRSCGKKFRWPDPGGSSHA